jgi:hypothetical protein
MRSRRLTSLAASLVFVTACTSRDAASDASRAGSTAVDSSVQASAVPWFEGVAPILLAPAHSNDRALVVAADSLAPDLEDGALEEPATLVRLDGSATAVRVALSSGSEGCVDGVLQPAPSSGWGIGFVGRAPTAIRVDSLRSLSRKDSAALAPMVFRFASGVPNAPGGRFVGLPFSLVDLWQARMVDGAIVVVATTKRQINQEDSPLEERTLVIAEADSSGQFTLGHSSRSTGPEETVEGSELLAVVVFPGRSDTQLIFAHDYGDEGSYSIVERARSRSWKLRWASRRFSC